MRLIVSQLEPTSQNAIIPQKIWGCIYVQNGQLYFPSKDWNDAVSSILDMWLSVMVEMIIDNKKRGSLFFMDGPFHIQICRGNKDSLVVSLLENNSIVHDVFSISFTDFVSTILSSVEHFVCFCKERQLSFLQSRTFSDIQNNTLQLKKAIGQEMA